MRVSAEIRWFWPQTDVPTPLIDWFHHGNAHSCKPGGGGERTDVYLFDQDQSELGIKRRGTKTGIEIKGLVAVLPDAPKQSMFSGPIEVWTKWTSPLLTLDHFATLAIRKRRWLRKFSTDHDTPVEVPLGPDEQPLDERTSPSRGCNVELTHISLPSGDMWWTFGFEAFGTLHTVEHDLRLVVALLEGREPPRVTGGICASYPTWITTLSTT